MTIETNQQLDMTNLISFKKKLRATELQEHVEKLITYISARGAKKLDGSISATYAVMGDVMDIEVMIPINCEIPSNDEFLFKPEFRLTNCIKISHNDSVARLQETIEKLGQYITNHMLTPSSACFIVMHNEIATSNEVAKADIYVPISIKAA